MTFHQTGHIDRKETNEGACTVDHYSTRKRNQLIGLPAWKDLEGIMGSEKKNFFCEKVTCCVILFIKLSPNDKIKDLDSRWIASRG